MLGRSYLINHCIYRHNEAQRRLAYEMYVTDRLQAMNDSLANAFGGSIAKKRYVDVLDELKGKTEPDVTAEQVISSISDKLERLNDERI